MKKLFPEKKGATRSLMEFLDKRGFYIVLIMCIVVVGVTAVLVTTHNITSSNKGFEGDNVIPDDSGQEYLSDFEGGASDTQPIGTPAVTPELDKGDGKATDGSKDGNVGKFADKKADGLGKADATGVKSETKTADNSAAASKTTNTGKNSGTKKDTSKSGGSKSDSQVNEQKFIMPVLGEITFDFAMDKLVYSRTLEDWRTHSGVDIAADRGTPIKAVAKGVISEIKNDPRFGITVIIEHTNGIKSVYSNLASAEMVNPNQKIEQGDIIGSIGDTAIFETAEQSHLHFEVWKDNEPVDPKKHLPKT